METGIYFATKLKICDIVSRMITENGLAGTASLFLALGDQTRLRLLNLMRDREICVSSFTGVLGQSQPFVSRHLAYLRSSGIVEARRDGKWIHYRIASNLDDNTNRLLNELFKWMESQPLLQVDRASYFSVTGEPEVKGPAKEPAARKSRKPRREIRTVEFEDEFPPEPVEIAFRDEQESFVATDDFGPVRHNEIEDFLL